MHPVNEITPGARRTVKKRAAWGLFCAALVTMLLLKPAIILYPLGLFLAALLWIFIYIWVNFHISEPKSHK
jgi:hypothetical protein